MAAPEPGSHNLAVRVVAALVLAPLTIAMAYAGGLFWTALVTFGRDRAFSRMADGGERGARDSRHGERKRGARDRRMVPGGRPDQRITAALVVGFAAVALLSPERRGWSARDFSMLPQRWSHRSLVRLDPDEGLIALIFVLLVVWVTDIGGYFGRPRHWRPKLWPVSARKKTWAGALGGFAGSLVIAAGFAAFGLGKPLPLLLLAAILSVARNSAISSNPRSSAASG